MTWKNGCQGVDMLRHTRRQSKQSDNSFCSCWHLVQLFVMSLSTEVGRLRGLSLMIQSKEADRFVCTVHSLVGDPLRPQLPEKYLMPCSRLLCTSTACQPISSKITSTEMAHALIYLKATLYSLRLILRIIN
jgi:hypothetical protein